jgi:glyoxylase-like metal-dependent hydrolase (beta-lactamase superfamily II)
MADDVHEVYAIHYGHHDRPARENYIGGDLHDEINDPLDYYVWAIIGPHGKFVVDTGFDAEVARRRKRTMVKPIGDGLNALGISPDAVKDVILSHLHYDHSGNNDLFPNARFHLQDAEIAYVTGRCMTHGHLRSSFEVEEVVGVVRKVFADRVVFHNGVDEIAPGITVHKIGGHTNGLQCVRVMTRRGPVVLAADATHLYKHIEEGRVFPVVYNVGDLLEGYRTIKRLAPSMQHIVPGHDPLVRTRYPAARPGVEGWIMRLDAEPKG